MDGIKSAGIFFTHADELESEDAKAFFFDAGQDVARIL
jgi:hypothetical protein